MVCPLSLFQPMAGTNGEKDKAVQKEEKQEIDRHMCRS
jgi:hypothetical protein